jgi:hypothetical protein
MGWLLSSVFTAGTPGKTNDRETVSSGQAAGVGEFAPASDDRMHLAAGNLLDRLRGRSAGRAADNLWHPGHWNEALSNCTKQIARQVFFSEISPLPRTCAEKQNWNGAGIAVTLTPIR